MKDVREYEGHYSVTKDGQIWSHKRNKFLKPILSNKYHSVNLCRPDKKMKFKRIHRIVAEAYLLNPENKPQVNHIDSDKFNNAVSNLEWCTASENVRHAWSLGIYSKELSAKGGRNSHKNIPLKLSPVTVKMIRAIYRITGKSTAKLAKAYKVSQYTMYVAIKGRDAYKSY